jgi:two-component system, NarL family, sensor histidine kinase UhpB
MSLTAHLLIRITLVGLLCWLGVAAAVVWQLQHEGEHDITAQADRLQALTEEQLRRQLIAADAGGRIPDLARVVAVFGRAVCLSYQSIDVSEPVRWGCDADTAHPVRDPLRAPAWLDEWLSRSGALPRSVTRTIRLWSRNDGTLTITPHRATLIESLWQRLRDLSGLTAATIIAVNLLVLLALRRLLRPTGEVLRALERLGQGDLVTRPAPRGPREFRRILTGIDHLRGRLAQLTAQRSELTARLIDSQETERRELARDLHDELGQCLAALQAVSSGIRMSAQAQEPARTEDTETLDDTIAQMLAGLRALLGRLRPPLLESQGLAFALPELVNTWNARQLSARRAQGAAPLSTLHAELSLPPSWPASVPEAVAIGVVRATQEALTNAARYASPAEPVQVQLTLTSTGELALRVSNACARQRAVGTGLGLRMMSERVQSLGGGLVIEHTPSPAGPEGSTHFHLCVRWPCDRAARPLAPTPSLGVTS